jgi:hypothetical protein
MIRITILIFFLFCSVRVFAQTDTTLLFITKNLLGAVARENVQEYYNKLSAQLDEKLSASLNSFQKLEYKVQKKIAKKDSLLAGKLILVQGFYASQDYPKKIRRIKFYDEEQNRNQLNILSNIKKLGAVKS